MEDTETIGLKFEGNGIKPSSVKASEIAELLRSFEISLVTIAKRSNPELNEDLINLSFEEIKESSLSIIFKPHIIALYTSATILATSIENNYFDDFSTGTLENIKTFTRFARRHDCTGFITKGNEKIAVFDKKTDVSFSEKGTLSGETTIYGEVTRAGGDNPRVTLRVNNAYPISFDVERKIAVELASNLYKEIGLIGKARWDKKTFRILEFYPKEIIHLEDEPLTQSFTELSSFLNKDDLDNLNLII